MQCQCYIDFVHFVFNDNNIFPLYQKNFPVSDNKYISCSLAFQYNSIYLSIYSTLYPFTYPNVYILEGSEHMLLYSPAFQQELLRPSLGRGRDLNEVLIQY